MGNVAIDAGRKGTPDQRAWQPKIGLAGGDSTSVARRRFGEALDV